MKLKSFHCEVLNFEDGAPHSYGTIYGMFQYDGYKAFTFEATFDPFLGPMTTLVHNDGSRTLMAMPTAGNPLLCESDGDLIATAAMSVVSRNKTHSDRPKWILRVKHTYDKYTHTEESTFTNILEHPRGVQQ